MITEQRGTTIHGEGPLGVYVIKVVLPKPKPEPNRIRRIWKRLIRAI